MSESVENQLKEIKEKQLKQQQADTSQTDEGIIGFEARRRDNFFWATYIAGLIAIVLYGVLIYWITCHGSKPNAWHTTLLLSVAATTLTIFILKLLSKSDRKEEKSPRNLADSINEIVDIFIDKLRK